MRARNIKPGIFRNEELGKLGPYYQILFEGLWCCADREGKMEDRPMRIKADIFPYYEIPKPLDEMLDDLFHSPGKFIVRYQVNGDRFIKILNFLEHQRPHNNESPSTIPEPPVNHSRKSCLPRKKALRPDSLNPDSRIPSSLNPDTGLSDTGLSEKGLADKSASIPNFTPSDLALIWNDKAPRSIPRVTLPLNPKRSAKVKSALKIRPDQKFWENAFLGIAEQPFLLGSNDRNWRADFDFVIENYDKVAEGKYKSETRFSANTIHNLQVMKEVMENRGIK